MQFQLSGLASGFDWQSMVDQLTELERAPQRRMRSDQAEISQKQSTLNSLTSELNSLKTKLEALSTGDIFDQRSLTNSDDTVATASTSASGLVGTYNLQVTQLATTSSWRGSDDVGSALHSGNDVSALTLSAAAFRTAITAGTITVNNQQITIATSDSLGDVLDAIKDAIGGIVGGGGTGPDGILDGIQHITQGIGGGDGNLLVVDRDRAGGDGRSEGGSGES
jgi:flagellar hook-associated protein 2